MKKKNLTPEPLRVILILVAILTTVLGQTLLYTTKNTETERFPPSIWLSLIGVAVFMAAPLLRPTPFLQKFTTKLSQHSSAAWILVALLLSVLSAVASYLFEINGLFNFIPVVSFWQLGAFCYLMAFLPEKMLQRDWKAWLFEHRWEVFWVSLIGLVGIGLRFYQLGALPKVINGDEARMGLIAQKTARSTLANPFSLWENIGALYLQLINFMFGLFGVTAFALRFLPAIAGSLAVFTTYLFARQVAGKRIALIAIALLATSHTHIHFSRTVAVSYIQGTWLIPLELYFLLSGFEKRSSWRTALSGGILAIHLSIYISAQITLGLIFIYILVAFLWLKKDARPAWRQITAFWGGFFITTIPELSYILRKPEEFFNRLNENGTYSGWLAQEVFATEKPALQILAERIFHVFLSFIYFPAIEFYNSPAPVLSFTSAVLFLLGLGYILLRARSLKLLLLNGYFWGITVAIGLFAIPPASDSYRILIALPAALLIAAIGLDQILENLGMSWQEKPIRYTTITSVLLTGLVIFNLWVYFFDFAGMCRYGNDPQTRFASYLGTYVKSINNEATIYLLSDDIFRYGTHASVDFLTLYRPILNIPDPLDTLTPVSGEIIIANPNRVEELRAWAHAHPGGQLHFEYDCQQLLLLVYRLP